MFSVQQLTHAQHRCGPRPERTLREDVDGGQRRALAARPAPTRPAARAHAQLGL
jgi:hypothetical protein